MKLIAEFTVPGEPKSKARPRVVAGHAYTPHSTQVYENLVRVEYERQCFGIRFPQGAQIALQIKAYYTIPKSVSKKKREEMLAHIVRPTKKPDIDNIFKIIADSLNKIAYRDDAQIVDGSVSKFYDEEPRVVVKIQNMSDVF